MRRNSYISLLFILLWSIPLVYGISIQVKQLQIREKQERLLDTAALQVVKVHRSELIRVHAHEILINGKRFDYNKEVQVGDWFTFTGLYDDQETELLGNLQEEKDLAGEHQLLSAAIALFHFSPVSEYCQYYPQPAFSKHLLKNTAIPGIASPDITTPPPKTVS